MRSPGWSIENLPIARPTRSSTLCSMFIATFFLCCYGCRQAALMKPDFDCIARLHGVRAANHTPLGSETNRVSAVEHGQWTQRFERVRDSGESLLRSLQSLLDAILNPMFTQLHAMRQRPNEGSRPPEMLEPEAEIVHPLSQAPQLSFRNGKTAAADFFR